MRWSNVALAAAALMAMVICAPRARAADGITPYANLFLWTGYDAQDVNSSGNGKARTFLQMKHTIGPTPSGIGVKGSLGKLTVVAEVGLTDSFNFDSALENLGLNELSAEYRFSDELILKAGHYFTPYGFAGINPFHNKYDFMIYSGALFDTPITQVQLSYKGVYLDLIQPRVKGNSPAMAVDSEGDLGKVPTKARMPRIAVGYVAPMPFQFSVHAVYQQIAIDNASAAEAQAGFTSTSNLYDRTITSYALGAGVNAFMPFGILHAFVKYTQNERQMGVLSTAMMQPLGGSGVVLDDAHAGVFDTTGYGANVGVSFRIGPLEPGAGVAYDFYKNDSFKFGQRKLTAFASLQYQLDKRIAISPCVEYRDYGNSASGAIPGVVGDKLGSEWFYGIAWAASL